MKRQKKIVRLVHADCFSRWETQTENNNNIPECSGRWLRTFHAHNAKLQNCFGRREERTKRELKRRLIGSKPPRTPQTIAPRFFKVREHENAAHTPHHLDLVMPKQTLLFPVPSVHLRKTRTPVSDRDIKLDTMHFWHEPRKGSPPPPLPP